MVVLVTCKNEEYQIINESSQHFHLYTSSFKDMLLQIGYSRISLKIEIIRNLMVMYDLLVIDVYHKTSTSTLRMM